MRELSHRSKNLLAIIQAIASHTARSATSLLDFRDCFSQRLLGIAASHDVLIQQNWEGRRSPTLSVSRSIRSRGRGD